MNKYQRWYNQLMARAHGRVLTSYGERHHIVPRSLGGGNDKSNLVKLTCREHFLAHWLLTKFTVGQQQRKMLHALQMMTRSVSGRIVAGWQFEIGRAAQRKAATGSKTFAGRKHSDDARKKMSAASKSRGAKHLTDGVRERNSDPEFLRRRGRAIAAGLANGKLRSGEHRARVSATSKSVWSRSEVREKAKRSRAAYWADPDSRRKQSEATKAWWAARRAACQ